MTVYMCRFMWALCTIMDILICVPHVFMCVLYIVIHTLNIILFIFSCDCCTCLHICSVHFHALCMFLYLHLESCKFKGRHTREIVSKANLFENIMTEENRRKMSGLFIFPKKEKKK